jgi:CxxC motif-containing protein
MCSMCCQVSVNHVPNQINSVSGHTCPAAAV